MDREAHDVEIRAVHGRAGDIADPLLYAIGTRFIEGFITSYIVRNLFFREIPECHIRAIDNRLQISSFLRKSNGGIYLVRLITQRLQHLNSLGFIMRFT